MSSPTLAPQPSSPPESVPSTFRITVEFVPHPPRPWSQSTQSGSRTPRRITNEYTKEQKAIILIFIAAISGLIYSLAKQ